MAELPPPFDDQSFREHARFVRALAGALARDRDEADEVVARTFASAVEQRPRAGAQLRGWLARVARRALSRLRRDDARRDAHESVAARSERVDTDPADLAARSELSDRIALAFAQLDEPAKSTLFLRFFADLTPKQIAARQQLPVETVKTRLKRGLAKLRSRLDEASGSKRSDWRATAIVLAQHGGPWVGIAKVKGVAAAAVLVVLAGAVAWTNFARELGSEAPASIESASAPLGASTDVDATLPGAESDVVSATADASAPQRSEERQLPFATGVVTDENGAPLAGVRVVASLEDPFPSHAALMTGMGSPPAPSHAAALDVSRVEHDTLARTDRDGRFVVRAAPEKLAGLYFVAPGRAPASCFDLSSFPAENQGRHVTLVVGCTIRGHVRDHDGRPVSGAMVGASLVDAPPETVVHGSHPLLLGGTIPPSRVLAMQSCIDASGGFELVLPRRSFRLDVGATGYVDDLEYCEGVDAEFEFTLGRSRTLLDVVDARTGAPVDGVRAL
ncbi:MAG TPA: sigma-70 family RNA polymerase sigma factor, partial [Planctomycetota bacterium]|nr:sigma-70 family RNA polymerase sigma factor [Planctomycetota bacterium]